MAKTTISEVAKDGRILKKLFIKLEEKTKDMNDEESAKVMALLVDYLGKDEEEFEDKIDGYLSVISELTAQESEVKKEIKTINLRAKLFSGQVSLLKKYLQKAMETIGLEKCKTAFNTVSIATAGGKARMDIDKRLLPKSYLKTITVADTDKIYEDLQAGQEIAGAKLLPRGKSLRIK